MPPKAQPQTTGAPDDAQRGLAAKALAVYARLLEMHGERPLEPRREPMHELVSTMLSHRTNARNEDLAFSRMWKRFGSWEAIRDAPTGDLAMAIATANFAEVKAPNIQKTLTRILTERGEADIGFLAELSPEEGLAWLTALPGVGVKTASLVLLFCFAKPVLPVDTHVHRVSQRLGLIGAKRSATTAHAPLAALLPRDASLLYNFHIAMLKHGQKICVWAKPRCGACAMRDLCAWYQRNRAVEGIIDAAP